VTSTVIDAGDGLPLTVPALLRARLAQRGSHPLLICDDEVLTYADAAERSGARAVSLLGDGVGKGTHVGLLYPNGAEFVINWLAAARIGAVTVPLSTFSTAAELRTLLRNADIEILLSASRYRAHDYIEKTRDIAVGEDPSLPALRSLHFDGFGSSGTSDERHLLVPAEDAVNAGDRMVIVHTSGSTSEPKGVIHQHGPLIRHVDNLNQLRRYDENEVLFSNSPFFWIGGFAYSLLGTLLAGATLVCSNATEPSDVLDLIERTRPTMVNGFAQSVAHLAKDPTFAARDLSSIRRGNLYPIMPADVCPADPELRHNMLGMTEAGSVCLASDDESEQPEHRRGSFGRPVPGFEAKLVDGELWFRGPFLMEGYYGRERHETFDADGWFNTGDLFVVDDDGYFYFKGRRGDMIKTSGANVSPREVEAAILDDTGLVAHVVGIDDEARGQVVVAAVRVPKGQDAPDAEELRTTLRTKLSAYKVPQRVVFFADEDVPMMSSGKLDVRALKELLRAP
jgi:acyl-CoA synthetase (AMP-forming)/AMP-acid ligase II